ncbi:MAG: hypothetical protein IJZ68_06725 [Bacteroidaceae bacterium]|nr:hypothetical protein [Bacteroidaceae bacterium]
MERRVYEAQEYDFDDNEFYHPHELSKKEKAERTLLIATILIAALIIICMSFLVVVLVILDPYEVATALESEGYVDIAGLLREAADIMAGRFPID